MFTIGAPPGLARATGFVAHLNRRAGLALAKFWIGHTPVNPDPVHLAAATVAVALIHLEPIARWYVASITSKPPREASGSSYAVAPGHRQR